MKRILAFLVIVAFAVSMAGCATICKEGPQVTAVLQAIILDAQALIAMSPAGSMIVMAAEAAIAAANAGMAKACPTVADIQAAQTNINQAMSAARVSGMKLSK